MSAQPFAGRKKDTAGFMLSQVWAKVRVKYSDAVLLSVSGRTAAEGAAECDPRYPMTDGWRYHFHSPKSNTYQLMGRCSSSIAGPHKEYRSVRANAAFAIAGSFIDSDRALAILGENGVSLDPTSHHAGGRRPFTLNLFRTKDPRFKDHPVLWEIVVGQRRFLINAATQKMVQEPLAGAPEATDSGLGSLPGANLPPGEAGLVGPAKTGDSSLAARPKQFRSYSAKVDLQLVRRYVRAELPGASLMAIDAVADAWGSVKCMGTGDGWAYYFYYPKTHAVEAVYACNGQVAQGQSAFMPVNMSQHQSITQDFIDSNKAVDLMLAEEPNALDEGMGRRYTRTLTMRLLHYTTSPFTQEKLWHSIFLWELEVGRRVYYVDAARGQYLGAKEKF